MSHQTIIKANGARVPFLKDKVVRSLQRSGADTAVAEDIANRVASKIKQNSTTDDVYRWAYDLLRKQGKRPTAARYSLKKAIMELGPSGYPFERFVGELLRALGYETEVGVYFDGKCVTHEVDVVAHSGKENLLIECKFHNKTGIDTNVKVPLYINSRFVDITGGMKPAQAKKYTPSIFTNTHFSKDAIAYGECAGIKLVGWRYPESGGLETLIEQSGLQPLTCLTTLKVGEKEALLKGDIVMCKDVVKNLHILRRTLPAKRLDAIKKEVATLCRF